MEEKKKKSKKGLIFLGVLLVAVAAIVAVVFINGKSLKYTLNEDSESYTLTSVGSMIKKLEIPETYKGKPVTALGAGTLGTRDKIKEVTFPASLKTIESGAFYGCTDLVFNISDLKAWCSVDWQGTNWISELRLNGEKITNLVIPSGVTEIKDGCFGVETITSVTFPEGLTKIGKYAFYKSGIESLTLPSSLCEIEDFAFASCKSLKTVVIPEGVTKIGATVFGSCEKLESVTLPSTLTEIGRQCFSTTSDAYPRGFLTVIDFNGIREYWNSIGGNDATGYGFFKINCIDDHFDD